MRQSIRSSTLWLPNLPLMIDHKSHQPYTKSAHQKVYKNPALERDVFRQTDNSKYTILLVNFFFYRPCKLPYEVQHTGFSITQDWPGVNPPIRQVPAR